MVKKNKKEILKYPLITATVFIAHALSGWLEEMVVAGQQIAWLYLFIWYTIFIWAGYQLIKKIIGEK